jgi:hypothetical protein
MRVVAHRSGGACVELCEMTRPDYRGSASVLPLRRIAIIVVEDPVDSSGGWRRPKCRVAEDPCEHGRPFGVVRSVVLASRPHPDLGRTASGACAQARPDPGTHRPHRSTTRCRQRLCLLCGSDSQTARSPSSRVTARSEGGGMVTVRPAGPPPRLTVTRRLPPQAASPSPVAGGSARNDPRHNYEQPIRLRGSDARS